MPLTKQTVGMDKGGEASASPPPAEEAREVATTKVRILYPAAFEAAGVSTWEQTRNKDGRLLSETQLEEATVDAKLAESLIAAGHAELIGKE